MKENKIKRPVKAVIKVLSFILILVFLLKITSDIAVPKINRVKDGLKYYYSTGYVNEPENSIDAFILGNSNAYASVSPMEIWHEYGYTFYNCGEPYLRMSDIYYRLIDILKYQHPSVIFLETDAFYSIGNKSDDLNGTVATNLSHYFPVFEYHNRWKQLSKDDFYMKQDYYVHISEKGYFFSRNIKPYVGNGDYMNYSEEIEPMSVVTTVYFDKVYSLCCENGIQIIFFSVPSPYSWNYAKHNGIEELAGEYGIPFFDINLFYKDIGMSLETDTRDGGNHLNHSGAVKISNYIGEYISKHFYLPDHRDDPLYAQWDEDYKSYEDDLEKNLPK